MKTDIYTEVSHQLLFSLFDSKKSRKSDKFRVHHHVELELGYIISGDGEYHLENERYETHAGDLFVVRANEQHCVPTIYSDELVSFNIHITPHFLWTICADFMDRTSLHALIHAGQPIKHHFCDRSAAMERIRVLAVDAEKNRFALRHALLTLLMELSNELMINCTGDISSQTISNRLEDIQRAISYIHSHITEPLTLEEIAKSANMCRSLLCTHFRIVTGISPYEYLLIRRVERAVSLLAETDLSVLSIAQMCGFDHASNFNKKFKHITGMTPREYRAIRNPVCIQNNDMNLGGLENDKI